jgi:hypothetical protein
VALTDRSGTIATGGTAQTLAPFNSGRRYLIIQNVSSGDLWIDFGTAAVAASPSLRIAAGDSYVMEEKFVLTESVSIIGATTGQAFTAKEV